jgi:hypothetical protein
VPDRGPRHKTIMKIERSSRANERKPCCRHVACQTNLGGGSLQRAQQMSKGAVNMGKASRPAGPLNSPPQTNISKLGLPPTNKRSQEVVDLTDDDLGPASKRMNNANLLTASPLNSVSGQQNYNMAMPVNSVPNVNPVNCGTRYVGFGRGPLLSILSSRRRYCTKCFNFPEMSV